MNIMKRSYTNAIVRPPGDSYSQAISSSGRQPDVSLARAQHAEYCQALVEAGLTVEKLPPDENFPDSCFVQDLALIMADQAITARPGATTRRGEVASISELLASRFRISRITAPGTLEFGDVMLLDDRVLVGHTERTNLNGIDQLRGFLSPQSIEVTAIPVKNYLHLLSAATYLGHSTILAVNEFANHPAFADMEIITVPPEEAYAANALGLGEYVILPAGFPRVAQSLLDRGFKILPVDLSQFEIADGGATCLSIVW